uniref:TIGR03617 family F420-dependent LLM class oxidoreductase n=1 Tax=Thermorudis peleae TaxID=1382356 RepID=A0A831TA42_9BACT
MRVEATLGDVPWDEIPGLAQAIEAMGFDGIAQPELKRDPFLPLALAAAVTRRVRLATAVAIAFPRSPMVVACTARGLHDLSRGRFVLGLGTQVRGHIERRFGVTWASPGPRLREYVQALRAVWATWQHGTPLSFRGRFYSLSLMTPEFDPGPSEHGLPKIHLAGVNRYNLRLAGKLADGLRVHPFSTPEYTRDVIWPNVVEGASRAGRSLDDFELVGGGFIATGATEEEIRAARERARYRIAFYGSTRSYRPVLEHHGWGHLNDVLYRLAGQGRWDELAAAVPDEVLDAFCISGTYDTIAAAVGARLEGLVDTVNFPLPADPYAPDERYLAALEGVKRLAAATIYRGQVASS